ncbi:DNA repair protein RecN [Thiorhodococcus fuscus]|uniref:DNA repair protein RecN n=1 Tax=Thiorhodococcus fuscus TaxID=527200 RepID=A0ABW4Y7L6_9GAMM
MLSHLLVRDLVIVSSLELDWSVGMTALTGETGAGKSILIDALGLVLGDKAEASLIRAGAERAEIVAQFDLTHCPSATRWLAEQDLDDEGVCILRRLIPREGRSRAYINGRPANGGQLRALGDLLVDIHGQHAHQSLLRATAQRDLLDAYGGQTALAQTVATAFAEYRALAQRFSALESASHDRAARLDLLRFTVDELERLDLSPGEIDTLNQEERRLGHIDRLQQSAARILQTLSETEPSVEDQLRSATSEVDELLEIDPELGVCRDLLETAAINAGEAAASLRHYLDGLEIDPGALDSVAERLAHIHDLARKYRVFPDQLPDFLVERRSELETLEAADITLDALRSQRDAAYRHYLDRARELSAARAQSASRLGETVTASMQELGMAGGRFEVRIDDLEPERAGGGGLERIEFLVSANPGQPLQALAKVASGGELSRISLSIQVATASCGSVPTLVFDEVDVGIGGGIAEIVGRLLRRLGASRQVLCVTHLPQVAAQAHQQYRVRKEAIDGQTHTHIEPLDDTNRIEEIARMLGGTEITRKTREHASEMLDRRDA